MLLCCRFSNRNFSSPSSRGRWSKSRRSKFNLSGFCSRSDGFRYTTNTPLICYSSAKIILSSSSTRFTMPCLRRYRYRSSSSEAASLATSILASWLLAELWDEPGAYAVAALLPVRVIGWSEEVGYWVRSELAPIKCINSYNKKVMGPYLGLAHWNSASTIMNILTLLLALGGRLLLVPATKPEE